MYCGNLKVILSITEQFRTKYFRTSLNYSESFVKFLLFHDYDKDFSQKPNIKLTKHKSHFEK